MIIHIEPDILECEVKWSLESITTKKASGGDGIPVKLFQILKDDAMKVLHSICQQIWKTQQWPSEVAQSCLTLCDPMDCSLPCFSVHGIFPGKNTGVGCHFLLQWIFLTQGSNPGLLHCRQTLYPLSQSVSPVALGSNGQRDWKRSVFIPIPKKGNAKNTQTTAQIQSSHTLVK